MSDKDDATPTLDPQPKPPTQPRRYTAGVKAALEMFKKNSPTLARNMSDERLLTLALGNAGSEAARAILAHLEGDLSRFGDLGSAKNIVQLRLNRVGWSTAVRCEIIFEASLRVLGYDPETETLGSGLLEGRKRKRPLLQQIARDMRRKDEPLEAKSMSDLELMTAYLESEKAARTLLEALQAPAINGSLLKRLDTIGSAETLIYWDGIHLGTAARIEVMFELALRIAGVMPEQGEKLEAGAVFSNK